MSTDIVSFDILLNGKAISSSTNAVLMEIEQTPSKCSARVEVQIDSKAQPIPMNKEFDMGADIEIKLGYDNKTSTAFKGKVTDKRVSVSQGVGAMNVFICEGDAPKKGSGSVSISSDDTFTMDIGCNAKDIIGGSLETQGASEYVPGTSVELNNIIEGFPNASIYSITHKVSQGNWLTQLHFAEPKANNAKIELATAKGNKIVLDDESNSISIEDTNGNSLVFSESGLAIKSLKNISITADQELTLSGEQGVSQQASGGDVAIRGMNTKISADMQASMEGSMTASVQGGTELTLKGAMVMIN